MNATNVQFGEPLLEFRLAYLRAIAKAWSDPEFEAKLLAAEDICRIPSDHIPIRSWPLFLARELMRDLIETLKAEQST